MSKSQILTQFLLPLAGLVISPRVFNELNPYAGLVLGAVCIFFLTSNTLKQIQK